MSEYRIFAGRSNPKLAKCISEKLSMPLDDIRVESFNDGEIDIEIKNNVRGCHALVIQSTCTPTNDNLMELLLMCDALKRSSVRRITAVIPYFGYARQDRRVNNIRVPISARVIANMLCTAGVDSVMTLDIHAEQIQGFFNIPVDNIYASQLFVRDIKSQNYHNPMIVSPDVGGVVRARVIAKALNSGLSIIDKRRPEKGKVEVMNIIGDVRDRTCIIIDDMIDTAGTLVKAAKALRANGAIKVYAYATHPVLSGKAFETLSVPQGVDKLIVTDSIPISTEFQNCDFVRTIPSGEFLADAISRLKAKKSVSEVSKNTP